MTARRNPIHHEQQRPVQAKIAGVIRALMAANGETQTGLAQVLHVDQSTVSAILSGIRRDIGMLRVLGKGQRERMVPIHPKVDAALGRVRSGPVFRRPMGGAWPAAALSRSAAVFLDGIGVDATLHQFRHWFGTRTYAACRDIRVVQELMGHSSPSTSAIYIAFSEQTGRDAVAALGLGMLHAA